MSFQSKNESVGDSFSLDKLLAARAKTITAVELISKVIKPGMSEGEAGIQAKTILTDLGMERTWHPTHIRFGSNTTKLYSEPSEPGVILKETDIYFIDIGPVFEGHEGDAGNTFTVGHDPEMKNCAKAVKVLFEQVKAEWQTHRSTGKALYDFAETAAKELGFILNLKILGHRLSDFPHAIFKAGVLATLDYSPSAALWILEMQIRHPTKPLGAFYEDLLV